MTTITLRHRDNTLSVKRVSRNVYLRRVGRRGPPGPPGTVPDATALIKGKLALTGDLGGTADHPLVKRSSSVLIAPYGSAEVADRYVQDPMNAQVEIQEVIDMLTLRDEGGVAELLKGVFVCSDYIVPRSKVWLKGQGKWGQTKICTEPDGTHAILDNYIEHPPEDPWSYGIVSNMELDGSTISRTSSHKCFNSSSSYKCQVFDIYAHDSTATGLGMDDYTGGILHGLWVENCGYVKKKDIIAASWAANTVTIQTSTNHNYVGSAKASGTLTLSGAISDGDTVTIDQRVYTFKTTLSGSAHEVLIGASDATALDNLKSAVNLTGTIGTDYSTDVLIHPTITASTNTDTTQLFVAKASGSTANSYVTTETGANMSFGAATLTGGTTGSVIIIVDMVPVYYNGRYVVSTIIDPTTFTIAFTDNTASLNLAVNPGVATAFGNSSPSILGHNGIGIASGAMDEEATIVSNCICVGNQNNNFLMEADQNYTNANASYIFSHCISIRAGQVGFLNTGTPNTQFNDCYDYGSQIGGKAASTAQDRNITAASWSGGIATFTTSLPHSYAADGGPDDVLKKAEISNMIPTAYNGNYTILSTPTSNTFTVAMTNDPGAATQFGQSTYVFHNVYGSSFNDSIFSHNLNWGIQLPSHSDGVMVKDTTIKYCYNIGIQSNSSNSQFSGLRICDSGRQGMYFATGNNNVVPMSRVDISDTFIWNSGKRGISTTKNGLEINPGTGEAIQNVTINNLQVWDDQNTKTQDYGVIIRSGGSLSNIMISGGTVAGNNVTGMLLQDTTDQIRVSNVGGVNPVGKSELGNVTGSTTFDPSTADYFVATLIGNITAVMPTPTVRGTRMVWVLKQDATGSRTLTLPVNATAPTGGLVLPTAANSVSTITWIYDGAGIKWRVASCSLGRVLSLAEGGTNATSASTARTSLGLGALATLATVGTSEITDAAVTLAKMANLAQDQFIGRTTASTGVPQTATITVAARTVLDDTTVASMVDTLGGASSTGTGGLVRATSPALVTPTGIVKGDVGLGNVDNTSDANKPVSTAAQTALDLKQNLDAELTALAGLTSAADKGIQFTGSGAAGTYDLTTAGKALLDDADATAQRTTLGLGTISVLAAPSGTVVGTSDTQTLTNKRITRRIGTVASSATPSINTDDVDQFNITALAAAITSMSSGLSGTPTDGQQLRIRIKDNGTARAITWGASFTSSGVASLPGTTVISKTHMIGLIYDAAAALWVCMASDVVGY